MFSPAFWAGTPCRTCASRAFPLGSGPPNYTVNLVTALATRPGRTSRQVFGTDSRTVPMTEKLAAALSAVRHLRNARVLLQDDGSVLTPKVLRAWIKSAQRLAGLKVTGNFHILRHTFCSHLAMRGAPARVIQELAGHVQLGTTMRYMHLSPGHKEQAIRLLDRRPEPSEVAGRGGGVEAESVQ